MKFLKYIALGAIGLTFNSCGDDFLSPLPETTIVQETFFQTDDDVFSAVVGMYDAVQGVNENTESNIGNFNRGIQFEYMLSEMRTDNTRTKTTEGSKADFHRYRYDGNNVESEDFYASMYQIIARANNVIGFIDVADAANRRQYEAEAKFMRAFAYFKLVRLYGDVPLVTGPVSPSETDLLFTRVSADQIYTQITTDLEEAITNLSNDSRARASRGAAQGLLAKVKLSQPNPDYAGAEQLCLDVVTSGNYSLQENYSDVFYNELNDEILWAVQYTAGDPNESQSFSSEFTAEFRQGRDDGHNLLNDNLIAEINAIGRDRIDVSYITLGSSSEVAKFLPVGTDFSISPPSYGPSPRDAGNDMIILRYADVLLMHAEAIMAGGAQTSSAAAIDSYMAVRARAGYDIEDDRPATLTSEELISERRVELCFENQRFYDLQRFGIADAVLSAHAAEMGYTSYDARKLLLPIPSREINLSKGLLTQNPGY